MRVPQMDSIEQAILYIENFHQPGTGKILVKTLGVRELDEEELLGWAFDFEGEFSPKTENVDSPPQNEPEWYEPYLYFHLLPSGNYAFCQISTIPNTGGDSIGMFSHCLIVSPRLLRAFHNNILSLYHSLTARSDFVFLSAEQLDDFTSVMLSPIPIGVRHTPVVDTNLIEVICDYPGVTIFSQLVSSSISSVCTIFTWLTPSIQLINGLIQCLPIALRPELSFATSLHFSAVRPLRLIAVHENSLIARNVCRQYAIPFLHLIHLDENTLREKVTSRYDWGVWIYRLLTSARYDLLLHCLQDRLKNNAFETRCDSPDWYALNHLGQLLLNGFDQTGEFVFPNEFQDETQDEQPVSWDDIDENDPVVIRRDSSHTRFSDNVDHNITGIPEIFPDNTLPGNALDDNVFEEIQKQILQPLLTDSSTESKANPMSQRRLTQQFPQYEYELRRIDSLVARSLFGDQMALETLEESWQQLRKRMTYEQAGVIRETYIHLVQSIIVQPRDPEFPKPAKRSLDSLDVLSIFMRE